MKVKGATSVRTVHAPSRAELVRRVEVEARRRLDTQSGTVLVVYGAQAANVFFEAKVPPAVQRTGR
ncbi:MAG: hypothetical protein K1X89_09260 [Myxococcaceae bacterium]|nr:hypothetical protein [Myxococcaceae bacterium]